MAMHNQKLTTILRLTAEMENRAADGDWAAVQELDCARLTELEKLQASGEQDALEHSATLSCLLESNSTIVTLAREAKSELALDRENLVRGRQASNSYQHIQEASNSL